MLEMAPDLVNAEVNTYDPIYDLAAFVPFDLDADWGIDAHGDDLLKCGDW